MPRIPLKPRPSAWACALASLALFPILQPAAAGPQETVLREDGLLEVDGRPFFPIGLLDVGHWRYPDWQARIVESKANLVWDIQLAYGDSTVTCEALVDSALAGGYRLLIGSGDTWYWDDRDTPELEVDQWLYEPTELPDLLACIDGVTPSPVIGFANRDEPVWTISRDMVGDIDSVHVADTYGQIHGARPGSFLAMNFAPAHLSEDLEIWKQDIIGYRHATDVMMFAAYPYPPGPGTCGQWNVLGYPDCTMDRLVIGADIFLNELNAPGQPLWMIIQAHKGIPYKESKWEAIASFVHGATGILWAGWPWWHIEGSGMANWPITVQVMNEMIELQEFFVGRDLSGHETTVADVDLRAKRGKGQRAAVFAISRNEYTGPASIFLPNLASGVHTVNVLGEGRTLVAADGWIVDHFDGYEAHVYQYQGTRFAEQQGPTSSPASDVSAPAFRIRAYPSPSRGRTTVDFDLPRDAAVTITVHDAAGRRVGTVGAGNYQAGRGKLTWSGRDVAGRPVAPGVYFLRGRTSRGESATSRVLIQR